MEPGTLRLKDPRDWLVYREGSGGTVEIFDIQVGSERDVGKGRILVEMLMRIVPKDCRLVFAITRANGFRAQMFYEHLGFRVVGVLRDFYQEASGEQAVDAIMYGIDTGRRLQRGLVRRRRRR